ncbi:sigma-54-dependent transcriptional regulator [Desulforhopalus singaporensis]|uniref:Two component, sigma54 specific, transcriptional regulator, Fis family n=1 Tax=Desulforhopalus singaporensis TaxID=91360 RepID=A0A1H0QRL3_9BACT|nr:sigma-54 dependent transcriptional regulator [Desulforhopalus singaporensis]SDP19328.1 two component, sigma54 specific, transcriptional regulator, Fis family [Desulforhopalus singaporensis]
MKQSGENTSSLCKILVVDDEVNMVHMLTAALSKEGYFVASANNGLDGLDYLRRQPCHMVLCDLRMPVMDGVEFLQKAVEIDPDVTVIMMSAYGTVNSAVKAMKIGAYDFITKPFRLEEVVRVLEKAKEIRRIREENLSHRDKVTRLESRRSFKDIVGESPEIKKVVELAGKVALHDTSVLITGESGTGKELIAQGIHSLSNRREKKMITVNCGSIPENLIESEFFGYVKGAFTGAESDREGLFKAADGGTIFLDEISELPIDLQVKLLRVLQEKEVRPLGSTRNIATDARVLAATSKNLAEEVKLGKFRQDLLFRLNVVELKLPPLRERREDITLLVHHFLDKISRKIGHILTSVSSEALKHFESYSWPGNIRELENAIERAAVFSDGQVLTTECLPQKIVQGSFTKEENSLAGVFSLKEGKRILERELIARALVAEQGNKSKAAQRLEISYPSLLQKIKEYDL